jgi:hypothetical protein
MYFMALPDWFTAIFDWVHGAHLSVTFPLPHLRDLQRWRHETDSVAAFSCKRSYVVWGKGLIFFIVFYIFQYRIMFFAIFIESTSCFTYDLVKTSLIPQFKQIPYVFKETVAWDWDGLKVIILDRSPLVEEPLVVFKIFKCSFEF